MLNSIKGIAPASGSQMYYVKWKIESRGHMPLDKIIFIPILQNFLRWKYLERNSCAIFHLVPVMLEEVSKHITVYIPIRPSGSDTRSDSYTDFATKKKTNKKKTKKKKTKKKRML